jgi:Na+/proline symporter
MPVFIVNYLPHGLIGVVVVALLSSAMGSTSSAINSLAAASIEDATRLLRLNLSSEQYLLWARVGALFWGAVTLAMSYFCAGLAGTVIEAINKVGSLFYGPILAMFLLAILKKRVRGTDANIGLVLGLLLNAYLWVFRPQVFWFWWNFLGCLATLVAATMSYAIRKRLMRRDEPAQPTPVVADEAAVICFGLGELLMLGVFLVIVATAMLIGWR